jgi:hypothetical protein
MNHYPKLSPEQLKRLRQALIDRRWAKSMTHAKNLTSNFRSCREQAVAFFLWYGIEGLEDISALYEVPEGITASKQIDKKVKEPVLNTVTEIKQGEPEPIVQAKQIDKKTPTRGKGKNPAKVMYPVRFDPEQLERLKLLGGRVSLHIRAAIDAYLEANQIDKKV